MNDTIEKKRLAILKTLYKANAPVISQKITEDLANQGYDISERTVRFHLLSLDKDGLTIDMGKSGRKITEKGIIELSKARVFEKIGYLAARIDQLTYLMRFNLEKLEGTVIVNVSLVKQDKLAEACPLMSRVFEAGYAMGKLMALFGPNELLGDTRIPDGFVGVGTVCSITINGVLLAHGIPTNSRFGGLLEIEKREPTRFVAVINYDGTTLDPLEIFVKSGMTNYIGAVGTGNGLIGASLREIPAASRERVIELASQLDVAGLGAFMRIGWPGQSILEIPINEGRLGAIVIGGLNPVAILEESGMKIISHTLAGFVDYKRLFPYTELKNQAAKFM
jgi:HTH-type transcriptional regulator, global nitrogen regulator NrpRI